MLLYCTQAAHHVLAHRVHTWHDVLAPVLENVLRAQSSCAFIPFYCGGQQLQNLGTHDICMYTHTVSLFIYIYYNDDQIALR